VNSSVRRFIGSAGVKIALAVVVVIASICAALCWHLLHQPDLMLNGDSATRVPGLIREMIDAETSSLTHEHWSPAMESLARIGPSAAPALIETIETARDLAISKCGCPPSEFCIIAEGRIIQTRSVMVLGRIGAPEALPVLFRLQSENELHPLRGEVDQAITDIKAAKSEN
jgi:hypothetical protein